MCSATGNLLLLSLFFFFDLDCEHKKNIYIEYLKHLSSLFIYLFNWIFTHILLPLDLPFHYNSLYESFIFIISNDYDDYNQ